MKAVRLHRYQERPVVQEVPDPRPGAGEALVRMVLSPIHNHDLWTVRGSYGFKPGMPARAGTEHEHLAFDISLAGKGRRGRCRRRSRTGSGAPRPA